MSFFPGHFETTKGLKNNEKEFSGDYFRNNFVSEGKGLLNMNQGFPKGGFCEGGKSQQLGLRAHRLQ